MEDQKEQTEKVGLESGNVKVGK